MIDIYRFSSDGFIFKFQNHLYAHANRTLDSMINEIYDMKLDDNITAYVIETVKCGYVMPDKEFEFEGIFVFLTTPSDDDKHLYLNHIKNIDIDTLPLHRGYIDDDAICYTCNGYEYDTRNKTTIGEAKRKGFLIAYIPKSEIGKIRIDYD